MISDEPGYDAMEQSGTKSSLRQSASVGMHPMAFVGTRTYEPIEDHVLYIGITSPPNNFEQRMLARQRWVYEARNYLEGRAKIQFVIGRVPIQRDDLNIHEPVVATEEERRLEQKLEDEANEHQDIKRVPVVESPLYETDKVLWILS